MMPTKKKVPAKKAAVAAPEFSAAPKTGKSAPKKAASKPKASATKTKTAPAKKSAAKGKTAPATKAKGKATASKAKTVSKARGGQNLPRVMNEHGFVVGSESEKIVNVLLEGGAGRQEVNAKVLKALGNKTAKGGQAPNVSSLIANILKRLKEKGYTVEATWQLHPPTPASKAAATRAAKRRDASTGTAPTPRKQAVKPAKKAVAKRAPRKAASKG